jgi:hypothetical protein
MGFDSTRLQHKSTIYHTWGEQANNYTTDDVYMSKYSMVRRQNIGNVHVPCLEEIMIVSVMYVYTRQSHWVWFILLAPWNNYPQVAPLQHIIPIYTINSLMMYA